MQKHMPSLPPGTKCTLPRTHGPHSRSWLLSGDGTNSAQLTFSARGEAEESGSGISSWSQVNPSLWHRSGPHLRITHHRAQSPCTCSPETRWTHGSPSFWLRSSLCAVSTPQLTLPPRMLCRWRASPPPGTRGFLASLPTGGLCGAHSGLCTVSMQVVPSGGRICLPPPSGILPPNPGSDSTWVNLAPVGSDHVTC